MCMYVLMDDCSLMDEFMVRHKEIHHSVARGTRLSAPDHE